MSAKSLLQTPHFDLGVEALTSNIPSEKLIRLDQSYWPQPESNYFKMHCTATWVEDGSSSLNTPITCDGVYYGFILHIVSKTENEIKFKMWAFGTTSFPKPIADTVGNPAPFVMDPVKHAKEISMCEYAFRSASQIEYTLTKKGMIAGCGYFLVKDFRNDTCTRWFDTGNYASNPIYEVRRPVFPNTYINVWSFDVGFYHIITSFYKRGSVFESGIRYKSYSSTIHLKLLSFQT